MVNKLNWNIVVPVVFIVLAVMVSSWLLREKPTMSRGERKTPPVLVEVARAELGRFPLTIRALGKVTARELVDLQPQIDGRVEWLDYDLSAGATIQKGQPLPPVRSSLGTRLGDAGVRLGAAIAASLALKEGETA